MWIPLQPNDLASRLSAPEFDAVKKAATGSFGNAIPEILFDTVQEIRGRVAACERNKLGPEGTIPEELKAAALAIARWRVLSRLPGVRALQDDARKQEYNDALTLLVSVAKCDFAIIQPEDAIEADIGAISPDIGTRRRQTQPWQQDGA